MTTTLIKIDHTRLNGETVQTVNARDLWEYLGSKRQFGDWIKTRIAHYGFAEDVDFTVHKFVNGRATVIDYHLGLDMAKELAMVENNAKGREIRRYFIECERQALAATQGDMVMVSGSDIRSLIASTARLMEMMVPMVERLTQPVMGSAPRKAPSPFTDEEKDELIRLLAKGFSQNQIARELNRSAACISKYVALAKG